GGTNAGDFDSWQRIKNAVRAARRPGFNANRNVGKPLAGAAAGAAVGYVNTGDLEGTAVGAAAGAAVAPAVTAKSLAHAGVFGLGYGAAGGFDEFSVEALLAGGGAVGAARFGAP